MIKSSKLTTKFSNTNKITELSLFINEYKNLVGQFIDLLWNLDSIPKFLNKEITDQVNTNLSARIIQCAGKQASGIVRGTKKKQEKRIWMVNKLHDEGKHKQARKLEAIINKTNITKPNLDNANPELDSRFIKMDFSNNTSFDGYLTLTSLYKNSRICIPIKKSKHFNKLFSIGKLKSGIRLNEKYITFNFEIEEPIKKETGIILGIDIGQNEVLSCSNGFQSVPDKDGHTLKSICDKLSRKQTGSRGFLRTQSHRKNFINYSINQLNLKGIKELRLENIKGMRKGIKSSRSLFHWTYKDIFDKIESVAFDAGVQIKKINPTYTSQRCSNCGWTRKSNRKGKQFKCGQCGFTHDSDLNAAINIALNLKPLGKKERQSRINRTGFYWLEVGQEFIVPDVHKIHTVLQK